MTKIVCLLACPAITGTRCFAQCETSVVIHSSATEYLDTDSILQKTVKENTIIEINRPAITISPGKRKMTGVITAETCRWTVPFVEGESVISATFTDPDGDKNVVITISGRAGRQTFLVRTEGMPFLIRVAIDKFEKATTALK